MVEWSGVRGQRRTREEENKRNSPRLLLWSQKAIQLHEVRLPILEYHQDQTTSNHSMVLDEESLELFLKLELDRLNSKQVKDRHEHKEYDHQPPEVTMRRATETEKREERQEREKRLTAARFK